MGDKCPRCSKAVGEDFVYCPYCGGGLKRFAHSVFVSVAGVLMTVSTVASFIYLYLSTQALLDIYRWYPQLTAQQWFPRIQIFAALNVAGLISGILASALTLTRRNYTLALAMSVVLAVCGGAAGAISLTVPDSGLTYSTLYYFLPLFVPSLTGTLLIIQRRAEF